MTPEQQARSEIDKLLSKAGWLIQDAAHKHISVGPGVAIREFPLRGHGFADYLLHVNGLAAGVIAAKKAGATLSGVDIQSAKYSEGLPNTLPAWRRPLPFSYQFTGAESRCTNGLDPDPRARPVFAFDRPETLELLDVGCYEDQTDEPADRIADATPPYAPTLGKGRSGVLIDLESAPETAKRGRVSRQWSYEQTAGAAEKAVPRAA